jgi:hypothetical protein
VQDEGTGKNEDDQAARGKPNRGADAGRRQEMREREQHERRGGKCENAGPQPAQ